MVGLHVEGSLSLRAWYRLGLRLTEEGRKTQDAKQGVAVVPCLPS